MVTGAKRGRLLGVPTANLDEIATVVPGLGVYAGAAYVNGVRHQAAIHLGPNPTFQDGRPKFEVHLLDFTGDLYGRTIAVEFLLRLRDIRKFADVETLKEQLALDLAARACVESVNSGFRLTDSAESGEFLCCSKTGVFPEQFPQARGLRFISRIPRPWTGTSHSPHVRSACANSFPRLSFSGAGTSSSRTRSNKAQSPIPTRSLPS